jgi:hypothetical protein
MCTTLVLSNRAFFIFSMKRNLIFIIKTQPISGHCTVKKVSDFSSPAGMSLTKLSVAGWGEFGSPLGTVKLLIFFYSVLSNKSKDATLQMHVYYRL